MRIRKDRDVFQPVIVTLEYSHEVTALRKALDTALEMSLDRRMVGRFDSMDRATISQMRDALSEA